LVAGLAQSHTKVLEFLLDMVGVTWPSLITHRARQLLDLPDVVTLFCCELIVHD